MEPPKTHPVDLNTPGLPKPYRELRSLINYLSLALVFGILILIYDAWMMATPVYKLNIAVLLILPASLVSLFFCRLNLARQKKNAIWFYLAPLVINYGYLFLTPGGISGQNAIYVLISALVSAMVLWMVGKFIKQGLLA